MKVEDFEQLIARHMEKAKNILTKFVRDREPLVFVQTAIIVLPDDSEHEVELTFPAGCETRTWIDLLFAAIQKVNPSAVVIRAAGIRLNSDLLSKEVDLSAKDSSTRMANIFKWLNPKIANGKIDSLPEKFFRHCLIVAGLGPRLPSIGMVQEFNSRKGVLTLVGEQKVGEGYQFPFLRKWWH